MKIKINILCKSIIAVLMTMICMSMCIFATGCSGKMQGEKVYKNYVDFINKEGDIFSFISDVQDSPTVVQITYAEEIENRLADEKRAYEGETWMVTVEGQELALLYSDFYVLKVMYEPMLEKSMSLIGEMYHYLKLNTKNIDKVKANSVNEALKTVDKTSYTLQQTITKFNKDYKNEFIILDKKFGYSYRNPERTCYRQLTNIKQDYENLIMACFDLNNKFSDLFLGDLAYQDFATLDISKFTNKDDVSFAYACKYLNHMTNLITEIAFDIDGGEISFINTREKFAPLYADNNFNEKFANQYVYDVHLAQISTIYDLDLEQVSNAKINQNLLDLLYVCQSQFKLFENSYDDFKKCLKDIDYKDFILSEEVDDVTAYMNGIQNKEDKSKFLRVYTFINDCYTPLVNSLKMLKIYINS